ncbi:hypothetical protein SSS_02690 [Sarcoptes scabiei]|nr:hypothetical protein SSS_02690 [Sarcoptes scabiei]
MILIIFSISFVIAITIILIWFSQSDRDLEVAFAERFGFSIEKFKDKVIWITGASSGIGEHLAYTLAPVGAKLIISGTDENKMSKVAQRCTALSKCDNVLVLPFNISNTSCHEEMFQKVLKRFKKLDILINNAGRSQRASFLEIDLQVDKDLFDVNVFGLINLTRIVLKYFLESNIDGQIGVTSSTAGLLGEFRIQPLIQHLNMLFMVTSNVCEQN